MNLAKIHQAIYSRLTGDATLAGLAAGGIRSVLGPRAGIATEDSKPYVVVAMAGASASDAFDADVCSVSIDVHVVSDASDGLSVPSDIIDRVIGDATLQSSRVPTYGLHRHLLALSGSSYTAGPVVFEDTETAHTEERLVYIIGFKLEVSRTAP